MNEEYNNFENNEDVVNKETETTDNAAEESKIEQKLGEYGNEEIPEAKVEDFEACGEIVDDTPSYYEQRETYYHEPVKKKKLTPLFVAIAAVTTFALVVGIIGVFSLKGEIRENKGEGVKYYSSNTKPSNVANTANDQFVPAGAELTTAEIAAKVGPSVVGIESKVKSVNIFGQSTSSAQTGSGVIVNEDGYIVTNYHVVEGANELKVILNSGKEYPAQLVGYDERSDLAIVKIDEKGLNYATFGDSSQLMVGERVVAIGNPLGTELMGTVTQGIISAVNRTVQVQDKTLTLLQTDAAINSGNSGGALINSRGEVIGINTIKMYATGVEGIGFAIPSNEVKRVLDDIMTYGYVKGRLVVGVTGTNVTEKMSNYYELPVGFYVSEVREGYGAYLAGVQVGDVIIKCDGKVVKTIDDINKIRDSHKVDDYMEIVVSRDGKNVTLNVKLMEEKPDR